MSNEGWIGVDLDCTLAEYHGWQGPSHIGAPIPEMVERVNDWLNQGREVRIFTARVSTSDEAEKLQALIAIQAWCLKHIGVALPVTCVKDFGMVELWDDRAVRVVANAGHPCCGYEYKRAD